MANNIQNLLVSPFILFATLSLAGCSKTGGNLHMQSHTSSSLFEQPLLIGKEQLTGEMKFEVNMSAIKAHFE